MEEGGAAGGLWVFVVQREQQKPFQSSMEHEAKPMVVIIENVEVSQLTYKVPRMC